MAFDIFSQGNCKITTGLGELGFSQDQVRIIPRFQHRDVMADDFPATPALILWMLADVIVEMNLSYFDANILDACIKMSMSSSTFGTFVGAGTIQTFTTLQVGGSGDQGAPWNFPKAYLAEQPMEWPLGNERSVVRLRWRAVGIPTAAAEVLSAGVQLMGQLVVG